MRRAFLLLPFASLPAAAQVAPASETLLRLSETGTTRRLPDELVATLRAEARAANAAAAQEALNRTVTAAMERARGVPAVQASTQRAFAYRQERDAVWAAQQQIVLRGSEGPAVLGLVGQLQQQGLAIADLSWRLSDATMRDARNEATREALRHLRARADLVAQELGMRVLALREVTLDRLEESRPVPRAMASASGVSVSRSEYTQPVSAPDEVTVAAFANGLVALAP